MLLRQALEPRSPVEHLRSQFVLDALLRDLQLLRLLRERFHLHAQRSFFVLPRLPTSGQSLVLVLELQQLSLSVCEAFREISDLVLVLVQLLLRRFQTQCVFDTVAVAAESRFLRARLEFGVFGHEFAQFVGQRSQFLRQIRDLLVLFARCMSTLLRRLLEGVLELCDARLEACLELIVARL